MGKGKSRVFHDVKAYVSCQEYDGIPVSVRQDRKSKVAPRVSEHSDKLALDRNIGMFLSGAFSFGKKQFLSEKDGKHSRCFWERYCWEAGEDFFVSGNLTGQQESCLGERSSYETDNIGRSRKHAGVRRFSKNSLMQRNSVRFQDAG